MFQDIGSKSDIGTPLALGGLIVSGLITIFIAILKLKIFPKLNRELGEKLISRMMNYLFILALVGLILAFVGYILPIIMGSNSGNGTPTPTPPTPTQTTSTPKPKPTISINVPPDKENTLEFVIGRLSVTDGRGEPKYNNCSNLIKKAKLKAGSIGGPDRRSLIDNLQFNLAQTNSERIYDVKLTEEGIYEIDCKY